MTTTPAILDDIRELFAIHGAAQYDGEPVTQLEHALQTAHLAEQSRADDELGSRAPRTAPRRGKVRRVRFPAAPQ